MKKSDNYSKKYLEIISSNEVIFITSLNFVGQGSKFLNSLLDYHEELFTCPFTLPSITSTSSLNSKIENKKGNLEFFEKNFYEIIKSNKYLFEYKDDVLNTGFNKLGDERKDIILINQKKFLQMYKKYYNLLNEEQKNIKNKILTFYICFNWCQNNFPTKNNFVLYTHDIHFTKLYSSYFKKCKFIASSRYMPNAFANRHRNRFLKHKFSKNGISKPTSYNLFDFFYNSLNFLDINNIIAVVILEELHHNPEKSMKMLAKYLNIKFSKRLLKSTVCNLSWHNNRKNIYHGFNINRHNSINFEELPVIIVLKFTEIFPNFLKLLNYPIYKKKININDYLLYFIFLVKSFSNYIFITNKSIINNNQIFNTLPNLIKNMLLNFYSIKNMIINKKKIKMLKKIDNEINYNNKIIILNPFSNNIFK